MAAVPRSAKRTPALVRAPLLPLAAVLVVALAMSGRGHEQLGVLDPARPVTADVAVPLLGAASWQRAGDGWTARVRIHAVEQLGRQVGAPDRAWLRLRGRLPPPPDRRLRARGYLSRRQSYLNLSASRPGDWGLNVKSRRLLHGMGEEPGPFLRTVVGLRQRLLEPVMSSGRPGAILAQALVFGDGRRVPPDLRTGLRRAGLSHLLAVSGLHVGLILGGLWWLLGGLSNRLTAVCGASVLLLYGCLVGPRPSLLRAAVMALLVILAVAIERPPQALNSLCAALILILSFNPGAAFDLGFQLSFLATAGILLLTPRLLERWRRKATGPAGHLAAGLAVTVAAQLATLPVTAVRIGVLTPLAPVLNLLFVPWTALTLGVSLMWVFMAAGASLPVLSVVAQPGAAVLLGVLDALSVPFSWLTELPPGAWLAIPVSVRFEHALTLAIWLGVLVSGFRRAAYALSLVLACTPTLGDPDPRLVMLDVGQGESLLLQSGDRGPVILVDGGGFRQGNFAEAALLQALAAEGIRRVDLAVLSHGDADHCRGLLELARYLRIERLWAAGVEVRDGCGRELARRLSGSVRLVERGHTEALGLWRLGVVHPGPDPGAHGNSASLVVRACAGRSCALLTGDLDLAGERELLAWIRSGGGSLRSEVLKVAHHGSRTSTALEFLDAVRPRLALLSAGRRNPYGHPAPEVVERIERRGARLLRTDRHGRIEVRFRPQETGVRRPVFQVREWPR
ncbi:MAG: DNA internalization-related competence protein ComEC/Rec2 [Acidobacteria bacterium]|nr:DNA internalization-related competence protein ComEC/Rec2 [Acidobacteriota bacterium]